MRRVTQLEAPKSMYTERRFEIEVPKGSLILRVDMDRGAIWCEVENQVEIELRSFRLYLEDEPIDLGYKFVKTLLGRTRASTMHLYERTH